MSLNHMYGCTSLIKQQLSSVISLALTLSYLLKNVHPLEVVSGYRLYTSESILTYKDGPRTERNKNISNGRRAIT